MAALKDKQRMATGLLSLFLLMVFWTPSFNVNAASSPDRNVILIGWDGAQREHLMQLLDSDSLPHLKKLIREGSLVFTEVTTGGTETKPGWAEILTGYSAVRMEIRDNRHYHPIPAGYTIFERLKGFFGARQIVTLFIGGKSNNIGSRGRHEICINCIARDFTARTKTIYWDRDFIKTSETHDGRLPEWVWREGEPYFYCRSGLDLYVNELGSSENVLRESIAALEKFRKRPFFAFFHFEEPDEQGHLFGENSLEYSEAIKTVDRSLGVIFQTLERLGIAEKTTIFVTSDHGMDEGGNEHGYAPLMFCATNSKKKMHNGNRKDITPTIFDEYGISVDSFSPPLDGKSLFTANSSGPQEKK